MGSEVTLETDQEDNGTSYDAFLREMAGSFEATYDDDDEASDEDDKSDAQGDKNMKDGEKEDYDAFLRDMAGSFEATYDSEEESNDEENGGDGSAAKSKEYETFLREMAGSYEAASDDEESEADSQEQPPISRLTPGPQEKGLGLNHSQLAQVPQSPLWQGSTIVRLANGELKHLDERPPVLDSYDMTAATAPMDPPDLELPQSLEMQRADLQGTIKMREKQVVALLAFSRKKPLEEGQRCHYGRVGLQLLAELSSLKEELEQLTQD